MKKLDLIILGTTAFFIIAYLFVKRKYRIVYVDNRNLPAQIDFLAKQAGKLKKAGLNHGWHFSKSISFEGEKFRMVIYILKK